MMNVNIINEMKLCKLGEFVFEVNNFLVSDCISACNFIFTP